MLYLCSFHINVIEEGANVCRTGLRPWKSRLQQILARAARRPAFMAGRG
jgi:hypothetical protein